MSNKNVKELVKNVIEENAVAFKATLNRTLYSKVGQKLQEKYIEVSKNIFESATVAVSPAETTTTEVSGAVADTNPVTSVTFEKAPWLRPGEPKKGDTITWNGKEYRYAGNGIWQVWTGSSWETIHWE
jgi:hypothetical protein